MSEDFEEECPGYLGVLAPVGKIPLERHQCLQELSLFLREAPTIRLSNLPVLKVGFHEDLDTNQHAVRLVLPHLVSTFQQ